MGNLATKKILVLVKDRQAEALRMTLGLTLADDAVDLYVLGDKIENTDANTQNLELLGEMSVGLFSTHHEDKGFEFLSKEEMASRLLKYDHILPY